MAIVIDGNNTPTAGGIGYGDGTELAFTTAGTSGRPIVSGGAGAPTFRPYTLPAADGSANQILQTDGSGALSFATASSGGFTLGTPVASTSGTSIDFTGIPATAKVIIINMISISTNGTTGLIIQIGDSGGIETTNYISCTTSGNSRTDGFLLQSAMVAVNTYVSQVQLVLENSTTNTWTSSGATIDVTNAQLGNSAGTKSLSAVLDRVRVTTFAPAATFDAGEINIAYI